MDLISEELIMVDFLSNTMPSIGAGQCHRHLGTRSTTGLYSVLLIFPDLAPKWIFLTVTEQRLAGWWGRMKGIVGRTKFTKLALTINYTIRKSSREALANDSIMLYFQNGSYLSNSTLIAIPILSNKNGFFT